MISKNLLKSLCVAVFSLTCVIESFGQTQLPLPNWSYNYSGSVRGYHFTAPVDFTMVGLRVAPQAGGGTQRIQVIKLNTNNPVGYHSNITTLFYTNSGTNGQIIPVTIPISQGDQIVILGYAGNTNPYGSPSGTYNLAGHGVTLRRSYAGNITGSATTGVGVTSGSISRVQMYYETCDVDVSSSPSPKTLCEGKNTDLNVAATITGGPGSYRWQVDEGSGFVDVTNGGPYSGATAKKLELTNTPYNLNGHEFRCIVEEGTCADTSMSAPLTVNGLVKLDDMLKNDTTCVNSVKDLEVKATGSITNYQWQMYDKVQKKFVNVPTTAPYNHMGNILRINGVPISIHDTKFRVLVNGVCDNNLSGESLLAVNDVPKTAIPPADVNALHGQAVTFEVTSTVTPAKYQWQVASPNDTFVNINEGGIYTGARSKKLVVTGVSRVQDNFKFRCVIKTAFSCVAPGDTSNFGILFVEPALSVQNITGDNKLNLYPNPTADKLFIRSSKSASGMKYMIIDKIGRTVLSGDMNSTQDTDIDVSSLPANLYLVKIVNGDSGLEATMKFTKM